mmetsp:Transcript_62175/g.126332  ORF Transcript_62175/g.126332 Transcript_62175/m.126332 type:complete len:100 (+) Transcript_62175:325-624(+)
MSFDERIDFRRKIQRSSVHRCASVRLSSMQRRACGDNCPSSLKCSLQEAFELAWHLSFLPSNCEWVIGLFSTSSNEHIVLIVIHVDYRPQPPPIPPELP